MKSMNLQSESNVGRLLAKSGSISFLLNVAGVGLAVLMQVVLARVLGVTSYGHYAFVMTVITFLVFPANLGFDTVIVRYVSSYISSQLWGEVKGLLQRANQVTFTFSILIMGISGLVIYVIYGKHPGELYHTFLVSLLVVPLMAVTSLRQSALLAMKETMFAQLPEKVMRPVCCMLALLLYKTCFHAQASAIDAMIVFFGSMMLSYVVGAWVLHFKLSPKTKKQPAIHHTKHWLSESTSLMVNSGMYLILGQLSVVMVGMMQGTSESGIFSATVRIATMVSFAITSINMIAAPIISECFAKGDMKQLQRICTLSGRSGFLFAALVFLTVLLIGPWLLGLFGDEFRVGQPALILLSLSHLVHAYCGQSGTVMTMTGQQRASSRYLMIAAGLNIVLNIVLVPSMGMVGAAASGLVSSAFCYFSMMMKVKKTMHITTGVWMGRSG